MDFGVLYGLWSPLKLASAVPGYYSTRRTLKSTAYSMEQGQSVDICLRPRLQVDVNRLCLPGVTVSSTSTGTSG
eukprot:2069446-Rhodomonas_salina.2